MEVLISQFVSDEEMDLSHFQNSKMQLAFFKRKTFWEFDHEYFLKRLKENNILIRSIHAPATDVYHQANNEFIRTLERIKSTYNIEVITLHPQRGERRQAKSNYRKLEQRIKELGLILAYETFEEEAMDRKWISQLDDMHRYFDVLKFPFLAVTYDFTHSTYERSLEEVSAYNNKIQVIHLSDALRDRPLDRNEFHQHLPLGYGDYRVEEFIELLIEINYKHFIVLEYHPQYSHLLQGDAAALEAYLRGDKEPLRAILRKRAKNRKTVDA